MIRSLVFAALTLVLLPGVCLADDQNLQFGGDQYASGQHPVLQQPVEHDAFMAGNDVSLTVPVAGNAHLIGMNVTSGAPVSGNLYAAGFTVNVTAPVTGSLSAAGNAVSVGPGATIGGNARLAGSSVTIDAPLHGSALVSSQSLTLNGTVDHDLSFHGQNLSFGPAAKVNGRLSIEAPNPITVPANVASADRVAYSRGSGPDYLSQAGNTAGGIVRGFWPAFWAIVTWGLLLFLIGAAFIAFAPRLMGALYAVSTTRPWRKLLLGILALAVMLGLVPILAITVIGLVLLPPLLLFLVVACSFAYIAGAFFVAMRLAERLAPIDSTPKRIGVLAVSLVVAGLLGILPYIGWLIGVVLMLYGLGLIATIISDRWGARRSPRPPEAAPSAAMPRSS